MSIGEDDWLVGGKKKDMTNVCVLYVGGCIAETLVRIGL